MGARRTALVQGRIRGNHQVRLVGLVFVSMRLPLAVFGRGDFAAIADLGASRVRGQIAPMAIAAATAVVAWPDGILANAGCQLNGA